MSNLELTNNESNAIQIMVSVGVAEFTFLTNDFDQDGKKNFWVGDVSGLYRMMMQTGELISLIDRTLAEADAAPIETDGLAEPRIHAPRPHFGYFIRVLRAYFEREKETKYDEGLYRNRYRFGFSAYPFEYGVSGRYTFMVSEEFTVFRKDTGGRPPEVYPEDPLKAGWEVAWVPPSRSSASVE